MALGKCIGLGKLYLMPVCLLAGALILHGCAAGSGAGPGAGGAPPGESAGLTANTVKHEPAVTEGQEIIIPLPVNRDTPSSRVVDRGLSQSAEKRIALTFDLGCLRERKAAPASELEWLNEPTISLLLILERYGVKATFFPQGSWLEDHPYLGREIARRGHGLGNHSYTHRSFLDLTNAEIIDELRKSNRVIEAVTGFRPYYYRPTFGLYTDSHLKIFAGEGFPYTIMWSVASLDSAKVGPWGPITPASIIYLVVGWADDGKIVLMHDQPNTVKALPSIILALRRKGFTFVTLDEMLPPPEPVNPVKYTVKKGDTLEGIARRHGVSVAEIVAANISEKILEKYR